MLSPDPASTLHSGANPKQSTSLLETLPMDFVDDLTSGSFVIKSADILSKTFLDHERVTGFHNAIPDVSPGSKTATPPVKYQFI